MNELQIFKNEEFGEIRTVEINGKPYFAGSDVAKALGYANPQKALRDHIDDEDKTLNESFTVNGTQGILINESGLYSLILSSKLESAKKFKKWVTSEVLPSIRKHGMYAMDELLNNPDLAINALTALKEEREKRAKLEAENTALQPSRIFTEAVSASSSSILIGDLAKLLKQNGIRTGQKRLFEWLREHGYLIKSGSSKNIPTQKAMERGLFEIKESSYIDSSGKNIIARTTKVTGRGQVFFVNKFLGEAS